MIIPLLFSFFFSFSFFPPFFLFPFSVSLSRISEMRNFVHRRGRSHRDERCSTTTVPDDPRLPSIRETHTKEGARDTTENGEANLTARCPISLATRQIVGCSLVRGERTGWHLLCLCGPYESSETESHFPDDHRLVKRTRENLRQFCLDFGRARARARIRLKTRGHV